jgi:hypothetical protein
MATRLIAAAAALFAAFYVFAVSIELFGLGQLGAVGAGSAGIGAVSVGFPGSWPLVLLASAIANRSVARWARSSTAAIRRLHRAHTVTVLLAAATITLLFGAAVAVTITSTLTPSGLFPILLVAFVVFFLGQLVMLTALLGAFTIGRRLTPNAG